MNSHEMTRSIQEMLPGVGLLTADDNIFFYYDPDGTVDHTKTFPFATLVTNDLYDQVSNLNRPDVFRLNIGVSNDTYRTLFGNVRPTLASDGVVDTGHDFSALDQILPHPVYAPQSWVCVLNPETTLSKTHELLAEAHGRAVRKYTKEQAAAKR